MAHAQKPDFVFHLNGRVHLNRRRSQFSRLLAAEVCASALVMLNTPPAEVVWEYWLPPPFASFPFTSSPVRHRVPPHSERSILSVCCTHVFYCVPLRRSSDFQKSDGKNAKYIFFVCMLKQQLRIHGIALRNKEYAAVLKVSQCMKKLKI